MPQELRGGRDDLASSLTRRLEDLVELVRARSLRPALSVLRIAVISIFVLIAGLAVLIAAVVGIIHLFDHDVFAGRVWATDFLFGAVFCASGLALLSLSHRARRGDLRR